MGKMLSTSTSLLKKNEKTDEDEEQSEYYQDFVHHETIGILFIELIINLEAPTLYVLVHLLPLSLRTIPISLVMLKKLTRFHL